MTNFPAHALQSVPERSQPAMQPAPAGAQEDKVIFTRTNPPDWLLAMWKEIDDKTFGKGFDCFREDAICNLGVA
ncbi:MAG: hypothetical protein ACREDC_10750, partial [Bradyrhizobium sp.]